MKGKSADLELRELAFQLYYECGGNKEMTLRKLQERGYSISKPTLYDWIEKFNFDERVSALDLKTREAKDAKAISIEDLLLTELLKQKENYEEYFRSLQKGKVDNQAMYAYANILNTLLDLKTKLGSQKATLFLDFLKDLVLYLSKEDLEAVEFIDRNFDGFVAFAKEKYGA